MRMRLLLKHDWIFAMELLMNKYNASRYEKSYTYYRHHLNESPWSVLEDTVSLNEYPNKTDQHQLRNTLANLYGVNIENVLLTRGSDEGIDLIMRGSLKSNDAVLQCPPTFSMYAFFATLNHAPIVNCSRDAILRVDFNAIKKTWTPRCKLIMLCRPNNPTADACSIEDIIDLCRFVDDRAIVVVDEAYIEFSNLPSATHVAVQLNNCVVLRTLSKAYGLAALRLGAIIANPSQIKTLSAMLPPYPFASPVLKTALRALQQDAWFKYRIQKIITARINFAKRLNTLAWINHVYESHTNFVLLKTHYIHELLSCLNKANILVRLFPEESRLKYCMRISMGDETMNKHLWNVISSFKPLEDK